MLRKANIAAAAAAAEPWWCVLPHSFISLTGQLKYSETQSGADGPVGSQAGAEGREQKVPHRWFSGGRGCVLRSWVTAVWGGHRPLIPHGSIRKARLELPGPEELVVLEGSRTAFPLLAGPPLSCPSPVRPSSLTWTWRQPFLPFGSAVSESSHRLFLRPRCLCSLLRLAQHGIICVETHSRNGRGAQSNEVGWVYALVGSTHFPLGHRGCTMSAVTWGGSLFAGLSGNMTLACS